MTTTIQLSSEQARHLLLRYHFTPTDLPGVFERLGTVQYDPLNPAGRNPDLVLQARVPGYRVDDWQDLAYRQRKIFDAWDKQACLVPIGDWPHRALARRLYRPYHDSEILQTDAEVAATILAALDREGPLSSLDFESKAIDGNSWYGATQAKRILRSLWANGELVTHHRRTGRHYYDRASRVIPAEHFNLPLQEDSATYYRWIIARRFQATGLLRPVSDVAIWSVCGDASTRKRTIAELAETGIITPVEIHGQKAPYYAWTEALQLLNQPPLEPRALFLGPLDNLLWDRKSIQQTFNFDYIWEVYKPEHLRKWGYYTLPVLYGDRFVARFDSRLEKGVWNLKRWWWEPDIQPSDELLTALRQATSLFLAYLGANSIQLDPAIDETTRLLIVDPSLL